MLLLLLSLLLITVYFLWDDDTYAVFRIGGVWPQRDIDGVQ